MEKTDIKALKAKISSNPVIFVRMAWIKFPYFLNFLIKKYPKKPIKEVSNNGQVWKKNNNNKDYWRFSWAIRFLITISFKEIF